MKVLLALTDLLTAFCHLEGIYGQSINLGGHITRAVVVDISPNTLEHKAYDRAKHA
ncbi:MAG: hypothetical protein K9J37_16645 [Saprospiraceae bacterium]|nr:hypothetical protein [Saprospiraceae bacterium]MCF8251544.1 hypothetical protein [Saprospiraceae bacterium]MCF8280874.1 hypothetical protein [Bacteroidales bacterium]MCF8310946.1 hypothetical protein [Saprospiraceae bacterium]MCF8439718.1 hypothetical protein [Saprospiraceae bacterium]